MLLDGFEVLILCTNPLLADSDLDGYSDAIEFSNGTDPLDPNDYHDNVKVPISCEVSSIGISLVIFTLLVVMFVGVITKAKKQFPKGNS